MSKKVIYAVVVLAILIVGGYFLYVNFALTNEATPMAAAKNVNSDFKTDIFSNPQFLGLKTYVNLPVKAGQKGKTNPFMKF